MGQTALAETHLDALDDAFERLYREHVATVYRYALGVLRNPADAEDVAQSTFTNAYRAIRDGEWPRKPENWLITIAHNECRQRFRRLGRRAIEVPLDEMTLESSSSDGQADTSEAIEEVLNALGELPFNQRAALVLREVSGRSATEIAQFLGTSVSAVDMLLFRARRTLRTQYAAVRTLALVPLPRSLLSFGGGSAAVKAGAVAGGLGVAGKVAAVLTAGAVAAGAGYTGLKVQQHREGPAPSDQRLELRKGTASAPQSRPAAGPQAGLGVVPEKPDATGETPATPFSGAPAESGVELPAVPSPNPILPSPAAPAQSPGPPVTVPSVPSPPAAQPPTVPPQPPLEPPALPPVEPPPLEPPPLPPVENPSLPSLPVEPPAVDVPPLLPETPTVPVDLPGP